ncbi:MAG: glycosyltransferase family 2 protein [Phycisphaerae bacterium]
MLDLSIIIVNWNTRSILCDCLRSIYDQGGERDIEVIVIDNASTDGSVEMVKKDFPQVTLIKNSQNLGFARANNIGIHQSSGRYICLVNSDVIVLNGCIENLISFMDNYPTAGMVGPRILNQDRTLQPSCRHFPTIWNNLCQALGLNKLFPKSRFFSETFMNYWAHDIVQKVDVLSGCFWMIRREALNKVGLLDEDFFIYGEDLDWCRRFHHAGWDIIFYPNAETIHTGAASSNNDPIRFYIEMQKADLHYWQKHHGSIGRTVYAAIIFLRHLLRLVPIGLLYVFRPSHRETISFKWKRSLACIRFILAP